MTAKTTSCKPGASTALARKRLSVPMRWLQGQGLLAHRAPGHLGPARVLDYGCGRGSDADTLGIEGYDPAHRPTAPEGLYDVITCTYVLNVVDAATEAEVLAAIRGLLLPGGAAYVAVRRDLPEGGAQGRGCWQRLVRLDAPLLREVSDYAIYRLTRSASANTNDNS